MTLLRELERDTAIGVGSVLASADLSMIRRPDCAATIWRRDLPPSFRSWIDALEPEQLPKARVILRPEEARDVISEACNEAGTPDCAERERLLDDVAALADTFAGLMGAPYLQMRLEVITTNACRKFHIDAVKARLICTYRGTGTQYGNAAGGAEPQDVFTVPTGAPILLRGTLWPESPKSGLLHRSPPIDGTGETRLLLVLDAFEDEDQDE